MLWARLTGVDDLRVWSFAAACAGIAAWHRGAPGLRVVALPVAFLLFAVAPPPRLVSEAFWWIQSQSARAATALVHATGAPILGEGILLSTPTEVFGIVESCSALGILVVLTAGSILARERIAAIGPRSWLLVALAPAVALALNLARITSIVLRPSLNQLHHLWQWAALLVLGSAALALIAAALARLPARTPRAPASRPPSPPRRATQATLLGPRAALPTTPTASILLVLAVLSVVPLPGPDSRAGGDRAGAASSVPAEQAGWTSQEVKIDRLFFGFVQFREVVSRRYERDDTTVYLLLGEASQRSAWSSPFSPKTILPGLRWVPLEIEADAPLDLPEPPDQTALVAREGERWWVAQWRFGDPGMVAESLRQLFALDASPFGDRRPRRVVRLAAPLDPARGDDVEAAQRAVVTFAKDFEDALYLSAARDSR